MLHRVPLLLMVAVAPAAAQQAPTPAPAQSGATSAPAPAPRILSPNYFGYAFAHPPTRGPAPDGSGVTSFPPNAVRYIDSYQRAQLTSSCLVEASASSFAARSYWEALPNSLPERRRLSNWARQAQGCYSAGFRVPIPLIRGALAEAELQHRPTDAKDTAPTSRQLTDFYQIQAARRRASSGTDRAMSAFASCVAPLARVQVRALLAIRHGDASERRAMDKVLANGSICFSGKPTMPDWGGTTFLRAYLAEATYRWQDYLENERAASRSELANAG